MPGTLEAMIVLIVFLVPGYVATVVFTRNAPRGSVSDVRFVLQIAFWGALVQLALLPFAGGYLVRAVTEVSTLLAAATPAGVAVDSLLLLTFPALVGLGARRLFDLGLTQKLLKMLGLSTRDSMPTAWDSAFEPGRSGAWLYVYVRGLSDPLIGEFGRGSIAGVSPYSHDLFLKHRYELVDGKFVRVPASHGLWISSDVIDYVEFLQRDDELEVNDGGHREEGDPAGPGDGKEGRRAKHEPAAAP